jgi:hypothetical protein
MREYGGTPSLNHPPYIFNQEERTEEESSEGKRSRRGKFRSKRRRRYKWSRSQSQ